MKSYTGATFDHLLKIAGSDFLVPPAWLRIRAVQIDEPFTWWGERLPREAGDWLCRREDGYVYACPAVVAQRWVSSAPFIKEAAA